MSTVNKPITFAGLPFDSCTVTGTPNWTCWNQTITWGPR